MQISLLASWCLPPSPGGGGGDGETEGWRERRYQARSEAEYWELEVEGDRHLGLGSIWTGDQWS